MFNIVKRYYDKGIYSKSDVGKFVMAGKITVEDYKTITGDDYVGAQALFYCKGADSSLFLYSKERKEY